MQPSTPEPEQTYIATAVSLVVDALAVALLILAGAVWCAIGSGA